MSTCQKELLELIGQAKRGDTIFIAQEEWTNKTPPSSTGLRKHSGFDDISVFTLQDKEGWLVFVK